MTNQQDVPVSLPIDLTTLAAVRQRVRDLLAGQADIVIEDAVQVTDELVSNAYQHGRPPGTARFTLTGGGHRLRIEVDDASPAPPVLRTPDRAGGMGLMLVDRLSSSWGVQHRGGHKTVWAEVALGRPGGPARHLTMVPTIPMN